MKKTKTSTKPASGAKKPAGRPAPKKPGHRGMPGQIRLIGGHWKRIQLQVADKPGLRPTPDRVRETLFNWLGQDLGGLRCVDAFAGTGALGFEAASRGAKEVLLVEKDSALVIQLQKVRTQLLALELPEPVNQNLQIVRGEGVAALRQLAPESQDVIFIDPPFDGGLFESAFQPQPIGITILKLTQSIAGSTDFLHLDFVRDRLHYTIVHVHQFRVL